MGYCFECVFGGRLFIRGIALRQWACRRLLFVFFQYYLYSVYLKTEVGTYFVPWYILCSDVVHSSTYVAFSDHPSV